jgi:hypothetical protein
MTIALNSRFAAPPRRRWLAAALFLVAASTAAQTTAPPAAPSSTTPKGQDALASLAWLEGCWKGAVTHREFTEQWSAPSGDAMRGTSRMIVDGVSQGDDALRLEKRADALYYVITPAGHREEAFRFVGRSVDTIEGLSDEIFTFENPAQPFPQRIAYRHTAGGALYAEVSGKVNGADRTVIYPMRKTECGKP